MNYVTLCADSDCTIDESKWGFSGYSGKCGGRLMNKPVPKGGQVVMLFNINRRYPCAHIHRHSLQPKDIFTATGPAEVVKLI